MLMSLLYLFIFSTSRFRKKLSSDDMSKNETLVPKKIYTKEQLESVPPTNYSFANADESDVEYYIFEESSKVEGQKLTFENSNDWKFDRQRPTKFLFHGYTTNRTSPWYPLLKDVYLKRGPHNIIYVDWQKAGNLAFHISAANIDPIGRYVAEFIVKTKIPLQNVHLIGHSLGSHLTGFIGKHILKITGSKIARITALDAAGPGFNNNDNFNEKLSKNDAEFVDVYHTDINYYGYAAPQGHVDFYPNGGKDQPGCDRYIDDNESHARSTLYFYESINVKVKAQSAIYKNEEIINQGEEEIIFGDHCPVTARGVFNLKTNASSPFLIK